MLLGNSNLAALFAVGEPLGAKKHTRIALVGTQTKGLPGTHDFQLRLMITCSFD